MTETLSAEKLAKYAMMYEQGDPIEWGELVIKEEDLFVLCAKSVLSMLETAPQTERYLLTMAALTKALTENQVLKYRLLECIYSK